MDITLGAAQFALALRKNDSAVTSASGGSANASISRSSRLTGAFLVWNTMTRNAANKNAELRTEEDQRLHRPELQAAAGDIVAGVLHGDEVVGEVPIDVRRHDQQRDGERH